MNIVPVHGSAALHFVDESALLLSDLHYGVEAEMLRGGVWVPNRSTARTEINKTNKIKTFDSFR